MANATLDDIKIQLMEQNDTLEDVSSGINSLVSKIQKQMDVELRSRGDELEEKRKASRAKKAAPVKNASTVSGSVAQGATGVNWGEAFSGFGFPAGLGIGAVAPFIARMFGRMIPMAAGAFFGAKFLDPWLEKVWPSWLDDPEIETAFGSFDASTIVSGIAGIATLLWGPKYLLGFTRTAISKFSQAVSGAIIGSTPKMPDADKSLVKGATKSGQQSIFRRIRNGLTRTNFMAAGGKLIKGGLIGATFAFFSEAAGEAIEDYTNSEFAGKATEAAMIGAGLGSLFGPWGMLVGALGGIAVVGLKKVKDFLDERKQALIDMKMKEAEEAWQKLEDERLNKEEKRAAAKDAYSKSLVAARLADMGDTRLAREGTTEERMAMIGLTPERLAALKKLEETDQTIRTVVAAGDIIESSEPGTDVAIDKMVEFLKTQSYLSIEDIQKEAARSPDGLERILMTKLSEVVGSEVKGSNKFGVTSDLETMQKAVQAFIAMQPLMNTSSTDIFDSVEGMTSPFGQMLTREDFNSWFKTRAREDKDFSNYVQRIIKERMDFIEQLMPPMPQANATVVAPNNQTTNVNNYSTSSTNKIALDPQTQDERFNSLIQ